MRFSGWCSLLPVHRARGFRCLGSQIDEVKNVLVVGNIRLGLTMFLPFEECVNIQLQLNHGCKELSRQVTSQSLEGAGVLFYMLS